MNNNPKVTIILPVYNVEKYLEACIISILNQTYQNLDIIAIDDGSTDISLSILKKYSQKDHRLRIVAQQNSGVSSARNSGLNQDGKGKYIYFIDSDDIIEMSMIEDLVNLCEKHDLDIIRFDAQNFVDGTDFKEQVNKKGQFTIKQINQEFSLYERDIFLKKSWYYALPTVWCYFFKAELLEKENKLRFEKGILHEDTLFIPLLLYRIRKIGYFKKVLYFRRIRPFSIMTNPEQNEKHFSSIVHVLKELDKFSSNLNRNEIVFKKYLETYKAKAFLLLNEYDNENTKINISLKKELGIKIPLFQRFLFIRRKIIS